MPALTITSFGYGHDTPPTATVTVDLRKILRDPHISPRLRHMTANDPEVRDTVWRTPGATHLLNNLIALSRTLMGLHDATGAPASIAIGCSGGRHRAPTVAMELHRQLIAAGYHADLHHRDLHRDVIDR